MSAHETITDIPGVIVEIHYDDTGAEDPRDRDDECLGAVIAGRDDHRWATFGDADASFDLGDFETWADVRRHLIDERGAIEATLVGIARTEHGSVHYEVDVADGSKGMGGNFYMGMDSAFIGWAYVTKATAERVGHDNIDVEAGTSGNGYVLRELAKSEAQEWASWAEGDVHGYIVRNAVTDEEIESCWGYIGFDWAKQAAREEGQACAEHLRTELGDLAYRAQVDLAAAIEAARRSDEIEAFEEAA